MRVVHTIVTRTSCSLCLSGPDSGRGCATGSQYRRRDIPFVRYFRKSVWTNLLKQESIVFIFQSSRLRVFVNRPLLDVYSFLTNKIFL